MNFEELITLAQEHRPDTEASAFGFRTRLEARLRELRGEQAGVLPLFTQWLWRTSLGLVPVVAGLMWFFATSHGLSLPEGTDGIVSQLTSLIPVETF